MRSRIIMSALVAVVFVAATASAAPYYCVTELGYFGTGTYARPTALNNNGDVVGRGKASSTAGYTAYLYTDGECYDLGTLPGASGTSTSTLSWASSINDSGQITGYSRTDNTSTYERAFIFDNWYVDGEGNLVVENRQNLGTTLYDSQGTPQTITRSRGNCINNGGDVVGNARLGADRGFLYTAADGMVETGSLGSNPTDCTAISNNGKIAGYSLNGSNYHAFIQNPGEAPTDLGTLGGNWSFGYAVNDSGQVAGKAQQSDGIYHAFIATSSSGMENIGTLGGTDSSALGINEAGVVVGVSKVVVGSNASHAFVYDGELNDLNNRINPTLGWTLSEAADINDNGQICGYGTHGTSYNTGYLLTPALPGDTDLNGMVDLSDLGTLLTFYNQSVTIDVYGWMKGDTDGSGMVDLTDLGSLLTFYNQGVLDTQAMQLLASHGLMASVPEPSSLVLLAIALGGLAAYVRRKRK